MAPDAQHPNPSGNRAKDEAVLRSVQNHEPGAFDRFVERFGNRIFAFGMRTCGHREDAEDVFQETLLTVYEKLQNLREPGALTSWLYRIVANTCTSSRRKSKFAPESQLSLDELLPGQGPLEDGPILPLVTGPEDELYKKQLSDALEKAVRDLPTEYRVIWMMRDVEGLGTSETARALGISTPNVKMRLHRARLALRKRLAHLRPNGGQS